MKQLDSFDSKDRSVFWNQTNSFTSDVRDRVADGMDRASSRVADLRETGRRALLRRRSYRSQCPYLRSRSGRSVGAALLLLPPAARDPRPDRRQGAGHWRPSPRAFSRRAPQPALKALAFSTGNGWGAFHGLASPSCVRQAHIHPRSTQTSPENCTEDFQ